MKTATKIEIEERLTLAKTIARAARRLTLPAYKREASSVNKNEGGRYDPVTQVDIDTEVLLRGLITQAFPEDGIEGEEFPQKIAGNNWSWTLDPIDGTRAFIAGVPVWSTLIAVSFKDVPLIGLIDLPALGETYIGANGISWKQTSAGRRRINTRACPKLGGAILSCTAPFSMFNKAQFKAYCSIHDLVKFSRLGLDAYGYALVASGRIDLVLEADIKPYDIRAIIPIIEGAGGIIRSWSGRSANEGGAIACAGDPNLLNAAYPLLTDNAMH